MKTFKLKKLMGLLTVFTVVSLGIVSCSDDDSSASTSAPEINSIALSADENLEPLEVGYANNMYAIQGVGFSTLQKVYFNDTDTYFNPTLVTENTIFVTIDKDTPYADASNELKIVTKYGTAVYPFIVAPPAPELRSFQPVNAADGEVVTLLGNYFLDPVVTVGGVEAEIVSTSLTEVAIKLPAGSQHKYIEVETISGSDTWGTAVGTAIYDDAFYDPWTIEEWNNHEYITDPAKAYQGVTFIKKEISGWDNIQGNWAWDDQISQYTGIRFSVRSDDPGKLVLIFNGANWGDANFAFTTTSDWKEYRYTWEELGGMPEALQNISFQEFTGATHNYYFDNIGFTVD
ncbi:hypothetical protein [Flavobacterium beibuense]|uniref:IPT/TIG domain-containing protein n=1 Tax=Flavobacterium beibuense TaxID=657326 RepID=A0A444W846_9FLAO|nr:hypothetical protein [Flavobacterium beibuense]RYJ42077.1 IPT/TIG domain-containing protein [Flavobacterium beibuense]